MRTLADTCVISEIWRVGGGDPRVVGRVEAIPPDDLLLSVVTIGELAKGAALLSPGRRRRRLDAYLEELESRFAEHILDIDVETAHHWGELAAATRRRGRPIGAADALIAATALRHGLRLMTRNVRDFEGTGVIVTNPWDG